MAEQANFPEIPEYYANMVRFETTTWDVRMEFGQMMRQGDEQVFKPRATITLPWIQAKAMIVYLQMNIFIHERTNSRINVPSELLPSTTPPTEESPTVTAGYEIFRKKLAQILATLEDLEPK